MPRGQRCKLLRKLRKKLLPTVLTAAQVRLIADTQPNLAQCHIALLSSERHRDQ